MYKYVAHILSTTTDSNGNQISEEAIKDLLKNQKLPIPVTINFDGNPIGVVGKMKADRLAPGILVEMDIITNNIVNDFTRVVPGGIVLSSHKEGEITVIDRFEIRSLSLTDQPADSTLRPMEKKP